MTEQKDSEYKSVDREKYKNAQAERDSHKDLVEKDYIPHFFPTYRIKGNLYPLPIILVVALAGILAFMAYVLAGIQVEGGYVSESEYGPAAGLLNGLIFTVFAVISAFIMIFFVKKYGINVLKYIFAISFGFIAFFFTDFYGSIIIYLIFINFQETATVVLIYEVLVVYVLPIVVAGLTFLMIYKYLTTKSYGTKNFIVLYIGLLIGATMGVIMPLWTTLAILIGISLWDIFATRSKYGPIKEMIDIAGASNPEEGEMSQEEIEEKIKSGEMEYDTSKLEIGIGDLAFYSMLTSSALLQTNSILVMIFTALAVIIGTGITITGLKRNKLLPGLPISIFLGIGTMLLSWFIVSTFSLYLPF
ncbi:MAG: hypothetical protein EU544_00930 [Promethearchaeota archaeon]|nr:MAG: hypothetical protein EU544_00930 [Candidatus Lokiarchaeota archaeon]